MMDIQFLVLFSFILLKVKVEGNTGGRAGTWFYFNSSWLLELKICFVVCSYFGGLLYTGVVKRNELENLSVSIH